MWGCMPPHFEERFGQLLGVVGPGHHEAREGQGRPLRWSYEPRLDDATFFGSEETYDLAGFKELCDLIVANRRSDEPADVAGKVYTSVLLRRD